MRRTVAFLFLAACTSAPPPAPSIEAARIAEHVRILADDAMQGRAPGTPGEEAAVAYIAQQFEAAGAAPAGEDGTYFQAVPLIGVEPLPESRLSWRVGRSSKPLAWLDDVVAVNHEQTADAEFAAETVFVGHGIVAPEFGWDDYKGVDVRGKIVLVFTNEPASADDAFFGGRALTYYGRWTFKYEEALRQGALGALIVHTDATAGYPWSVVRNSWGRSNPFVALAPGESALRAAGWLTAQAALPLLHTAPALAGKSAEDILALAQSREFQPIALGARIDGRLASRLEPLRTRNVIAKVEGSDPKLRDEAVLYTAHWDHLGAGEPDEGGDRVYNGAVDNATGVGLLLELARAFAAMPKKPSRTILFAAVGAEEGGLRGSHYYGEHPAIPAAKTAVNLNFDGILPLGETRDLSLPGYERTTLAPLVEALAREFGVALAPEANPEQGYYYRSDHFSLARVGVPAFSVKGGQDVIGKDPDYGARMSEDYRDNRYHRQADEFDPSWDFSGLAQIARFGFELGRRTAELPALPTWKPGDEFLPARERSWGR